MTVISYLIFLDKLNHTKASTSKVMLDHFEHRSVLYHYTKPDGYIKLLKYDDPKAHVNAYLNHVEQEALIAFNKNTGFPPETE